jgi:hypothetical protein
MQAAWLVACYRPQPGALVCLIARGWSQITTSHTKPLAALAATR